MERIEWCESVILDVCRRRNHSIYIASDVYECGGVRNYLLSIAVFAVGDQE